MPHILLRTSADLVENVDMPDIMRSLADAFSTYETVSSKDVKAYHEMHKNWAMGADAPCGFAHLQLSVLEGRTPEQLQAFGNAMFQMMKELFAQSIESGEISPTVEIRQMPKSTYWK